MQNKGLALIVIFFGMIFMHVGSPAKTVDKMTSVKPKLINTSYINLNVEEHQFSQPQLGGGAIVIVDGSIVLGKSDATFVKINPNSWESVSNYLPALETGAKYLKESKRYKYKELLPRIEDLIFFDGTYYASYTRYNRDEDLIYFVIAKIKPSDNNKFWTKLYESPGLIAPYYTLGLGGKMAIKNGLLFFSVGDFSLDRVNGLSSDIAAQNPNLPWGKINYINLNDSSYHLFSLGHRNPLGLLFLKDGTLLSSENGPQGGDELNIIKEGLNYGWPYESLGTVYGSFSQYKDYLPKTKRFVKFEAPIYAFLPSPSLSEIVQLSGFDLAWDDDLLVGSLKALTLFHIRLESNRVVFVEPIILGYRIRGLKQTGKNIYILTDVGSIVKITALPQDSKGLKAYKRVINKIKTTIK
jgi:hypothetical protein